MCVRRSENEDTRRTPVIFRNVAEGTQSGTYRAMSCPCSTGGGYSFVTMDGAEHYILEWDLLIAHPPCTYLTNTGSPYLNVDKYGEKAVERYINREKAFEFFMRFVNADCKRIAIENPVGYVSSHYRKPNQIIQPYHFGAPYTKATCLWLKGLPCLIPEYTEKPKALKSYARDTMYDENGKTISWSSELSKKLRSKTFEGIAAAMAEQWGGETITVFQQVSIFDLL